MTERLSPREPLSPQERVVFDHMIYGAMSAKQTAILMKIGHRTVEFYARRIREKFEVDSIKKLMALAFQRKDETSCLNS